VPLGIVLAVASILAATLTLLPAALAGLGHRINGGRVRLRGAVDHRSGRFEAWGRGCGRGRCATARARWRSSSCSPLPALGLRTGMPTAAIVPEHASAREGDATPERAFGPAPEPGSTCSSRRATRRGRARC
jgi:RND superfamily putative drug exporter